MSKGQRIKIVDPHEKVFYLNIGTYLEMINIHLSEKYDPKPLSEYIRIVGGYAFKSAEYKAKGIPIIRISDFNNERVVLDNVKYFNEDHVLKRYELKSGDIIIAQTGGTIGKLAVVQGDLGKIYLNQRVGKFDIINPDDFEKEYIYWIARGLQDKIKALAWGGAQPNVSGKQIEAMLFPIPSKEIQKEIINFLNDLKYKSVKSEKYFDKKTEDKIVQLQDSQMQVLKIWDNSANQEVIIQELRQSILRDAIEGKLTVDWRKKNPVMEPASELLKKIKTEKEKLIVEKKINKEKSLPEISKEDIPFDLPESWEWCRLGEISIRIHYGFNASANRNKKEVRLLRITDIQNNKVEWENVPGCDFSEADLGRYLLNENDILIARTGGTIGKSYMVKGLNIKSLFASYLIRVIPSKEINPSFLKLLIGSPLYWKQLYAAAWGAGQPNVNATSLSKIIFSMPPLVEQKAIVEKVENLMQKLDKLEAEISQNQKTADMLMQAVFKEAFEG